MASELQSFSSILAGNKIATKEERVTASAPPPLVASQSRWRDARARFFIFVAAFVASAILVVFAFLLTSARRTDDAAQAREQKLVQQAVLTRGLRILHEVESVAATSRATKHIRQAFDPAWVDRRVGGWLETYFDQDLVVVVDATNHVEYARSRIQGDLGTKVPEDELAPSIELLRRKLVELPSGVMRIVASPDSAPASRSAVVLQHFMGKPAFVAAVAVGEDDDLAHGAESAPIVLSVKYLDGTLLKELGFQLQLRGLREADDPAEAPDPQGLAIGDAQSGPIVRLSWIPSGSDGLNGWLLLPIALSLAGLALLVGLVVRHMRGTAEKIAAGESQLLHLALHDPVCGLPNRIYFGRRLEEVIGEVRRGSHSAAVFYIDLDHFKDVNDTLGHHIGDELILSVTQRLSRIMREDDLVARLGGDEFAIITVCPSDSYSLQAVAGRIISGVCAPYSIDGHTIVIGASIGIAVIDRRARAGGDILRYADMALYRAKNEGRNRACVYDAAMDADLSQRKLLEGDLRDAIKNNAITAAYQPVVNSSGEVIIGVEALARWTHPTAGVIPPSEFIPVAENSGLIVELGEYMLRRACLDGRDWPNLTVAVNVSPLQFRRSDFVDMVERILKETEFDPNRLELELTESTLLGNLEAAETPMLRLKAIGVRFALDDFGTGYSSLLYLRRFPFDKLKIDSSFVRSIETAPDAAAIVHAVVSLGRGLGMRVTAEGVETAEQHLFLRAAGVHSMQGYRFGRPGPAADITARLNSPDDYRVASPDQEIALAG
jgi:diguanylate cyclase (GGDEF)-like protein